jgi:hypothetical protein
MVSAKVLSSKRESNASDNSGELPETMDTSLPTSFEPGMFQPQNNQDSITTIKEEEEEEGMDEDEQGAEGGEGDEMSETSASHKKHHHHHHNKVCTFNFMPLFYKVFDVAV